MMEYYEEIPFIQNALKWFLQHIDPQEWISKKAAIKEYIQSVTSVRTEYAPLTSETSRITYTKDQIGWYLYIAEAYIENIDEYDLDQGSRVIPIFIAIGQNINFLAEINGVDELLKKIIHSEKSNPDGGIFELLVALAYKKNGWNEVILIPESADKKSPDIYVRDNSVQYYIECKRMSKSSEYALNERKKWLHMWGYLDKYILGTKRSIILDIVFHVELEKLEDNYLEVELLPKLNLAWTRGILIDNNTWTVSIDFVDYERIKKHMRQFQVKVPSTSLGELIVGPHDYHRGCTFVVEGKPSPSRKNYISSIVFGAGAVWSCDAEEAIRKKARYIRRQLAKATNQLPDDMPGIIHIGLESYDGGIVEQERFDRIVYEVFNFDSQDKDVHWIYCHLFLPTVPPDKNWDFAETVYRFSKHNHQKEPLERASVALPDDAEGFNGVAW